MDSSCLPGCHHLDPNPRLSRITSHATIYSPLVLLVRGEGRPKGFGGGGLVNDDVDATRVGRSDCDTPFPFSAADDGVGGFEDPFMTAVCCSCESLRGEEGSKWW